MRLRAEGTSKPNAPPINTHSQQDVDLNLDKVRVSVLIAFEFVCRRQ
jgi:hypothetical protein